MTLQEKLLLPQNLWGYPSLPISGTTFQSFQHIISNLLKTLLTLFLLFPTIVFSQNWKKNVKWSSTLKMTMISNHTAKESVASTSKQEAGATCSLMIVYSDLTPPLLLVMMSNGAPKLGKQNIPISFDGDKPFTIDAAGDYSQYG